MKIEYSVSDFPPDLIAGLINAIISIVFAMALAALVFTGSLSGYLSQGIGILLLGTIILSLLSAILSSHPLMLNAPQEIPIIVLALIAATIAASPDIDMSPAQLFSFLFLATGLTSVLIGLFFFILGWLKLGKVVRFIPWPVIGGFLSGIGWLLIEFAFSMMTDLELSFANISASFNGDIFYRWFPGLVFAILLLVLSRNFKHFLLIPGMLLVSIILFYAFFFNQGLSYSDIEDSGYLLGPFPAGGLFPGFMIEHTNDFRWDLYLLFLPMIATTMFLSVTEALLNYTAMEALIEKDIDIDKELRVTGFSNIMAGMVGAPAGFIRFSQIALAKNIGSKSRIPSLIVALLCTLTLIFGADVLSVFPKMVLGGLLLNLGLVFLAEWLYDTRKKLPWNDYLIIVLILIVIANIGFLEGVLVGLALSVVFFVINYSKVKVVKHELTGRTFRSNVERSERLDEILEQHDEQILILSLQGFIFFGSTPQLLKPVINRLAANSGKPLKFVVFDFRHITGLDSSAINSFKKLGVKAKNEDFSVALCGLNHSVLQRLTNEGLIPDNSEFIQVFDDLDHGLEWCEEEIIKSILQSASYTDTAKLENSEFKAITSEFSDFLEDHLIPGGTTFIQQGQNPGGIYFIESGEVIVVLDTGQDGQIRLKAMSAGTIVGEVSLYSGEKATASVITESDCQMKFLSRDNFEKLNLHDSDKASQLHIFIVKLLSGRLAKSNKTMRALLY